MSKANGAVKGGEKVKDKDDYRLEYFLEDLRGFNRFQPVKVS